MKRLILTLLFLLTSATAFAGTIPITGTIRQANGNLLTGSVEFTLNYSAARDTCSSNIVVAQMVKFAVSNGALPTNARITPNDCLSPTKTTYTARYYTASGQPIAQNVFYIQGTTFNLGAAIPTPLTTSNISFGELTGLDDVSSKRINNIQYCNAYTTSSTGGAKWAAAIGQLPSTGGVVDCSGLQGPQTITSDPFAGITKPVHLILSGAIYAAATDITIPANVTIEFRQGSTLSMNSGKTLTYNGGIISDLTKHFDGAGSFAISGMRNPEKYPEWFGASADGTTDNSTAIQKTVTAMTGGGVMKFSSGTYYMTDTVTIGVSTFEVRGAGEQTTLFKFVPTSAKSAFKFVAPTAATINNCVFRDAGFNSTDSTYVKVAVDVVDGAECTVERVTVGSLSQRWTDSATKLSVGIQFAGRQNLILNNTHVFADQPYHLKQSPNTNVVEIDASTFSKNTGIAYDATTNPVFLIDDNVLLTNVRFQDNNCVLGSHCIKWVAPSNAANSFNVIIQNNRWEQTTVGSSGYCFDLEPGFQAFALDLAYNYCPSNSSSIKVRNFLSGVIRNNMVQNTGGKVLDLDSTDFLSVEDNFFDLNNSTVTLTGFVANRWCGNDRDVIGHTTFRCAFGVTPTVLIPDSALLIPNAQVLSGMNAAGSAEILAIGVNAQDRVSVAPSGTTEIEIGRPGVAMGGGAAPTLGTIGGSGPAAAGQVGWIKLYLSGTSGPIYVPFWQ